ncbi:hypothetical protein C8R46DRAFT_1159667 [Mycena filopes]|nr:hypothetical protein C8R46DRAFT_1159667 [Mycena filopes]
MALAMLVDVHTHVYLPRYCSLLRSRTSVPRILASTRDGKPDDRLLILDHEPSGGRPEKIKFMNLHGIDLSIVRSVSQYSRKLWLCNSMRIWSNIVPTRPPSPQSLKRLYGFGLLPLVPEISTAALVETIEQISKLSHLKGIIMGTRGVGKGLDDEALGSSAGLVVFLHPHYGATTRLILAGVFDRFPSLRLLLAHFWRRTSATFVQIRLVASRLKHDARWYLGKLYFDCCCIRARRTGLLDRALGSRRMLFGTDHPFFPPLQSTEKWKSVVENLQAIDAVAGWGQAEKDGVRGGNALSLFNLA